MTNNIILQDCLEKKARIKHLKDVREFVSSMLPKLNVKKVVSESKEYKYKGRKDIVFVRDDIDSFAFRYNSKEYVAKEIFKTEFSKEYNKVYSTNIIDPDLLEKHGRGYIEYMAGIASTRNNDLNMSHESYNDFVYKESFKLVRLEKFDYIFPKLLSETEDFFIFEHLPPTYRKMTLYDLDNKEIRDTMFNLQDKYYKDIAEYSINGYIIPLNSNISHYRICTETGDIKVSYKYWLEQDYYKIGSSETAFRFSRARSINYPGYDYTAEHPCDIVDITPEHILKDIVEIPEKSLPFKGKRNRILYK